jgi:predicted O-methyltransferase YrrM
VLALAVGARSVLELGTLTGYSTIWLARALPAGGRVVTLESDPQNAETAVANLARAGVQQIVELRVGRAAETMPRLVEEGAGPFDLVFVDADKRSNPEYLPLVLELSRPGTLIVADNVVRDGLVADPDVADPDARGARTFVEMLGAEPRVRASASQTVGAKGHDGFALAVVVG